jgi:hypothetical protein
MTKRSVLAAGYAAEASAIVRQPMSNDLRVEISPPISRWMALRLSSGSQQFGEDFATSVFPFLEQLCDAIRVLHDGYIDETIRLLIGAPECELRLQAEANSPQAVLKINLWPDSRRSALVAEPTVFRFNGQRQSIVLPFVAALKNLRAKISDTDFEREYGGAFPTAAYAKLMLRLQ